MNRFIYNLFVIAFFLIFIITSVHVIAQTALYNTDINNNADELNVHKILPHGASEFSDTANITLPSPSHSIFFDSDLDSKTKQILSLQTQGKIHAMKLMQQSSGGRFIENKGQVIDIKGNPRPDIKYYTENINGMQMYFFTDKISYVFSKYDSTQSKVMPYSFGRGLSAQKSGRVRAQIVELYRMDMNLIGAAPTSIECDGESTDYMNYYYARCPNGILSVHSYSTITYKNIYPNIDLIFFQNPTGVEYDFVVNPGGNVSDIQYQYNGESNLAINSEGKIGITNPFGKIEEAVPCTFQTEFINTINPNLLNEIISENIKALHSISVSYIINNNILSFIIDNYDHSQQLIIDPTLSWCTFYGGSKAENEVYQSLCIDNNDNILITGRTLSSNFPVTTGAFQTTYGGGIEWGDAFVVKLNAFGERLWATYYGGSGDDVGTGIATDVNNNVVITGITLSSNFPVSSGAYQTTSNDRDDAFIVKLDSMGARKWATYYGGTNNNSGYGIATDANGNIIITGETYSTDFPVTSGAFQTTNKASAGNSNAFLSKIRQNGNSDMGNIFWW